MADPTYGSPSSADGYKGERMPFSAIPKRWPLVTTNQHRSAETTEINKDARLMNCYAELEPTSGDYQVEKRPGHGDGVQVGSNGQSGLGIFTPVASGVVHSIFNNKVYHGTTAYAGTVNTSDFYRWTDMNGVVANAVLGNGSKGYYVDGVNLTQITDADFPATFCPGWAYLDGTLYVLRPDGGIQGSAIDDPSSWDPLNLIIARTQPGQGIALIKHLTYVVALKSNSVEPFYNAGNPTGSPLARVDGGFIPFGCRSAQSVVEIDGMHFWLSVSANRSTTVQAVKLENLQLSVISTPPIERVFTEQLLVNNTIRGYGLKLGGHRFVVWTELNATFSLVYDLDQKLWYQWYTAEGLWPYIGTSSGVLVSNTFQWTQHYNTGKLYITDTDFVYPNDNLTLFPVDIYTPNVDFGIRRKKQLNAMLFNADQVSGSELWVRSSEDDYKNWTNYRKVNLGLKQPILSGQGSFFRRAYNFRHYKNTPFRISAVDLQMDIGTF